MGHTEAVSHSYTIYVYPGALLPKQYLNFVFSRWAKSYRHGNDYIKLCDSDSYFAAYRKYILALLLRPETRVRIAALSDEMDIALGFAVIREKILDYVHVHKDFRKQGIGRYLVGIPHMETPHNNTKIEEFTHLTKTGMKLWPTKLAHAKFNPFA